MLRLFSIPVLLFLINTETLAGYIDKNLLEKITASSVGDEIPVIIFFSSDTVSRAAIDSIERELDAFKKREYKDTKAFKDSRKVLRKDYIQARKSRVKRSSKLVKKLLKTSKVSIKRELWLVNAVAVNLAPSMISILSNHPSVNRIELDAEITLSSNGSSFNSSPSAWNISAVNAPNLWDEGIMGEGIVLASMDTGVDGNHPDLVSSWRGGANSWFDPYSEHPLQPHDGVGHGTQVMGVMVGGDYSGQKLGVAPGSQWISVKIFRDNGTATISAIHSGFQWMLDPDGDPATDDAPDIVNNSWGLLNSFTSCDTRFHPDIDALKLAGIEVIFSAGNGGPNAMTLYPPADYAEVMSVGSIDEYMNVANTSSRGPSYCSTGFYPNIVAPGVGIYTTDLSPFGVQYATVDGTSFAAPHLSGIIALLKSSIPTANYTDIRNAIYSTAIDLGAPGPDDITGYGMVDAYAALLKLRCPVGVTDTDGDGWYDACDNCIDISNSSQLDSNGDGFGNICDADLNDDGNVGFDDYILLLTAYGTSAENADLDGDGQVGFNDYLNLLMMYGGQPGPSGIAN